MRVVVAQVHVEREEVALGGARVIGAAQRHELGLGTKGGAHPRDRVGVEHAVGVHEEHQFGRDRPDAGVARSGRPLAHGQPHDAGTELTRERAGPIRRARIDDDDGHVRPSPEQRRERAAEELRRVVGGHDHGELHGHGAARISGDH